MKKSLAVLALLVSGSAIARPAPLVSIPTHDAFFDKIAAHCGKAYQGKVTLDNQGQIGRASCRERVYAPV